MRVLVTTSLVSLLVSGCAAPPGESEGASRFREAIPREDEVALAVPRGAGAGASTKSLAPKGGSTTTARWYAFTRDMADGIDHGTARILGLVWAIVQLPPTTVEANAATWGPGSDPLDPITWRLVVVEVAEGTYDYRLEGRPKASTDDADFRAILEGRGHGTGHPSHRTGTFTIDNDAKYALDPARAEDVGAVRVDWSARAFPTSIVATVTPFPSSPEKGVLVAHLTRQADGAGVLDVTALADVEKEGSKDGDLEDVAVRSRWTVDGAVRADVTVRGGSLPPTMTQVSLSECWSTAFARTYYTDSIGLEPTTGDPSACPFPASP